ncbi:uncharacterized protein METZ01_LOCUS385866, partial [marine metagenome]
MELRKASRPQKLLPSAINPLLGFVRLHDSLLDRVRDQDVCTLNISPYVMT